MIEKRNKNENNEKLYDYTLKFVVSEYDHKLKLFDRLDTKAQQIAGFSGILLGFIANLCKEEAINFIYDKSPFCLFLDLLCAISLLCAFLFSMLCMLVAKLKDRPSFSKIESIFKDAINKSSKDNKVYDFIYEEIMQWKIAINSIQERTTKKSVYVEVAQKSFGLALFSLGLSFIIVLFLILN